MRPENLLPLKDDMVAFISGHGLRMLPGYVSEDLPTVLWDDAENPDSWKDFVEMAKATSAIFVTLSEHLLDRSEVNLLLDQVRDQNYPDDDAAEIAEAQWLTNFVGKLGYLQLGFVHQGIVFVHETSTEWYDRYEELLEEVEGFGDILIEDTGGDDEDR